MLFLYVEIGQKNVEKKETKNLAPQAKIWLKNDVSFKKIRWKMYKFDKFLSKNCFFNSKKKQNP